MSPARDGSKPGGRAKAAGALPAGTYRFLVAPRLADGLDVPAGRYRVRVSAVGPDGRRLTAEGGPLRIAE